MKYLKILLTYFLVTTGTIEGITYKMYESIPPTETHFFVPSHYIIGNVMYEVINISEEEQNGLLHP